MKRPEDAYRSFEQSLPYLSEKLKIIAYEELAKIAEHHFKEYDDAQVFSKNALCLIGKIALPNSEQKMRLQKSFEKRLTRLIKKESISRASAQFDKKGREN